MRINKLLLVLFVAILSLVLVACTGTTTTTANSDGDPEYKYTQPTLTNSDDVVYTKGDIVLTKGDIYKALKMNGGMDQLLISVDERMLADKISQITPDSDAYKSRYNRVVYGTDDEEEIAKLENKEEKETTFIASLNLLGFVTQADKEKYIKILVAREQTAYDYMKNEAKQDTHGSFYYTASTIENFYGSTKNVDSTAKAIVINYKSMNEFYDALASIDGNIAFYNGKFYKNPNNVSRRNYSEETLVAIETAEVKTIFETLYARQYGAFTEAKEYDYNKLQSAAPSFADKLFALSEGEYTYIATKNSVEYGDVFSIAYRTEGQAKGEWKTLTSEQKEQIESDFCEYITSSGQYTTTLMGIVRNLRGIEFKDMSFGYKYYTTYCGNYKFDTEGDEKVLVTWDGGQLTVDDYYNESTQNNVAYYAIYAAMPKLIESTKYFSLVYGANTDLATNASLRKAEYTKTVNTDLNSNYVESQMHFKSVYLYNKYGVETVEDAVIYNKMMPDFQYLIGLEGMGEVLEDELTLNADTTSKLQSLIDTNYDNYYKLSIYQVTLALDDDLDFLTDDGAGYDHTIIEALVALIKEEIKKDENGDESIESLTTTLLEERINRCITAYNDPDKDTRGVFTATRQYNVMMQFGGINAGNALERISYKDNCTEEMNAALIDAYEEIMDDINRPSGSYAYTYSKIVYDEDGAHLLFVYSPISQPSYQLEETGDYSDYFLNENEKMTTEQLGQAYYAYVFKQLFTDATKASDTYGIDNFPGTPSSLSFDSYSSVVSSYYSDDSYANIYFIDKLLGSSNAEFDAKLQSVKDAMNIFLPEVTDFDSVH